MPSQATVLNSNTHVLINTHVVINTHASINTLQKPRPRHPPQPGVCPALVSATERRRAECLDCCCCCCCCGQARQAASPLALSSPQAPPPVDALLLASCRRDLVLLAPPPPPFNLNSTEQILLRCNQTDIFPSLHCFIVEPLSRRCCWFASLLCSYVSLLSLILPRWICHLNLLLTCTRSPLTCRHTPPPSPQQQQLRLHI